MNLAYFHILSSKDLSKKIEFPEHMFRPLRQSGFLRLSNGTIVVTINSMTFSTKLTNELFDPNNLSCRIGTLLRALPAQNSSIETKYETRSEIIFVTLEACIGVSSNNQITISTINQKIILSPSQVLKDVFNSLQSCAHLLD